MLNHLLLFRMALVNFAAATLAVWAYQQGYIVPLFEQDTSRISYAIVALFTIGLASGHYRAWRVGEAKDEFKQQFALSYLQRKAKKMASKNEHIADIANWLFTLGMLGTVIGFYIALVGYGANDTAQVTEGMRVAIGTTIIGGCLALWIDVLRRMLDTATAGFLEDVA
jgi:hypothetical protein